MCNSVVSSFLFPPVQSIGTWKPWQAVVNQRKGSSWLTWHQRKSLEPWTLTNSLKWKKAEFTVLTPKYDAKGYVKIDTNILVYWHINISIYFSKYFINLKGRALTDNFAGQNIIFWLVTLIISIIKTTRMSVLLIFLPFCWPFSFFYVWKHVS